MKLSILALVLAFCTLMGSIYLLGQIILLKERTTALEKLVIVQQDQGNIGSDAWGDSGTSSITLPITSSPTYTTTDTGKVHMKISGSPTTKKGEIKDSATKWAMLKKLMGKPITIHSWNDKEWKNYYGDPQTTKGKFIPIYGNPPFIYHRDPGADGDYFMWSNPIPPLSARDSFYHAQGYWELEDKSVMGDSASMRAVDSLRNWTGHAHPIGVPFYEGDTFWSYIKDQLAWYESDKDGHRVNGGDIIGGVLDSIPVNYFRKFLGKRTYDSLWSDWNSSGQY